MTVDLYSLSGAVNQGNMRTAAIEAYNRDATAFNNELAGRIAEAKRSTTEGEAEIGAADAIKSAIAGSAAVSSAQAFLASKGGQIQNAVEKGTEAIQQVRDTADKVKNAVTNVSENITKPPSGIEPPASAEEGGLMQKAMGAAGITGETAAKLTKGLGLVGDAYTIGTDIEADLHGQFQKMDWEQKVGNVGGILGSSLDIVGTAIPPLGVLKIVGTGISALSSVFTGVGDEKAQQAAGNDEVSQLEQQKKTLQQVQSNAGKAPILAQ